MPDTAWGPDVAPPLQEFAAAATETTWTLQDTLVADQTFAAAAVPSTDVYWGGLASMQFDAEVGGEAITGTGAIAFAGPAVASTGLETFAGTGDETVAGPALAATALEIFTGTGDAAVSGPSLAAEGSEEFTGTGAVTVAVVALEGTGEEAFASTGAVVFSGPALDGTGALEGGEPLAIDGTGAVTIQAPNLAGVGIGGVEAESGVVGVLGWRRVPQQAAPSPITGIGAIRLQAPHMVASGVLAISGIGTKSIGVVRIAGEGGQRIRGIGEMGQRVAVEGTGAVFTRRVVRLMAAHPARAIQGAGTFRSGAPVVSAVASVARRDLIDREWTALQQQAEDDEALCLLGVLDV